MTQSIDQVAQREFVDNDSNFKLVLERHNQMHQKARSAKQDILIELRKIYELLLAFDLCVEKAWEHEDIEEDSDLDQQLKRLTPDGSDIWFSHYHRAAELIEKQMLDQCRTVLMVEHAADKLKKEASSHCVSLSAAREEAQKRYVASLEPAKRGPGRPKKNA
tara:strand:- start:324 stop:809 length:486 start_codon:yes stop_codon:yes gene_type:complete